MRRWLILLMILFTPLRVMAADMMAIAMAAHQGMASQALAAAPAQAAASAHHADCADHVPPAASADAGAAASLPGDDCPTCASCMVCSSAALALQMRAPAPSPLPHAVPSFGMAAFHSAAPLPGFKPPIS